VRVVDGGRAPGEVAREIAELALATIESLRRREP
jgi:hypothetical protein